MRILPAASLMLVTTAALAEEPLIFNCTLVMETRVHTERLEIDLDLNLLNPFHDNPIPLMRMGSDIFIPSPTPKFQGGMFLDLETGVALHWGINRSNYSSAVEQGNCIAEVAGLTQNLGEGSVESRFEKWVRERDLMESRGQSPSGAE